MLALSHSSLTLTHHPLLSILCTMSSSVSLCQRRFSVFLNTSQPPIGTVHRILHVPMATHGPLGSSWLAGWRAGWLGWSVMVPWVLEPWLVLPLIFHWTLYGIEFSEVPCMTCCRSLFSRLSCMYSVLCKSTCPLRPLRCHLHVSS